MHIEMKPGMWWVQSLMKVWVVIFYKTQEWHGCPAVFQKPRSYKLFSF